MSISIILPILIMLMMNVVRSDLVSFNEDPRLDPFLDPYLKTIFRLDRKTLMKIPTLDDVTFLSQLKEGTTGNRALVLRNNPTSIRDDTLDGELRSQSEVEETWDEIVIAGPASVNCIANLIVLSSQDDFSFASNNTHDYIKYPNSFRTTLVQIADEMYNAFIGAHTNMDRIQLNMQQIPQDLKIILQLLTSASPRLIQSMLPISLANIERISKQCADAARSTQNTFLRVTALLQEVTQATIYTHGYSIDMANQTRNLINSSMTEQANFTAQLEEIRKSYEEAREVLARAQDEFYKAYHAIPTGVKRSFGFVESLVDGAVKVIGGVIGGVVGGFGQAIGDFLECTFFGCSGGPSPPVDNSENARKAAELALQALRDAQVRYDKWYVALEEKQNKLLATTIRLSQLNIYETDYKKRIEILVSATYELSQIEKQWSNMTIFFNTLATRVEVTRETISNRFIETIKTVLLNDGKLDDADREFFVPSMLAIANDIDQGAHLLYIMAKTYYDVSSQYMINQIAGLASLAVIQTQAEREARMNQISNDTLSTSAKVSRMALDRKQQYKQRNQARQYQYNLFIQQ